MKAKRFKTKYGHWEVELQFDDYGEIMLGIVDEISERITLLTPAQARRIAAHLLKLAEMREKESKQ